VDYRSPDPGYVAPSAQASLSWTRTDAAGRPTVAGRIWSQALRYAALWLVGGVAILVAPRFVARSEERVVHALPGSAGLGVVALIGAAAATFVIGAATLSVAGLLGVLGLGGLSLVTLGAGAATELAGGLALLVAVAWLAHTPVALAIGRRLVPGDLAARSLGLLILVLLELVPIVGWVVGLAVTLVGLGALLGPLLPRRGVSA
jgi:hypothetical protein